MTPRRGHRPIVARRWCAAAGVVAILATACGGEVRERREADGPSGAPGSATTETDLSHAFVGASGRAHLYVVLDEPGAVAALGPDDGRRIRERVRLLKENQGPIESLVTKAGGRVTARFQLLANALQVVAPTAVVPSLRRLPGVARVEPVTLHRQSRTAAVPRLGATSAWQGLADVRGEGVRVGIIDSGIDYTHADFGGPGTREAFRANDPNVVEPGSFPTARVVGGFDFVGDAYNPQDPSNDVPVPDPDPLDCGGHGSHVSGIAVGSGVTADGETFDGPFEQSFDPGAFLVLPGVAPRADVYALKVFGCAGATSELLSALEWAADPDGDGDPSDRLDVVNGSLGQSFAIGSQTEADVITNLSSLGTLVVAAVGNDGSAGKPFYTAGSPATYTEVLAVGATLNRPVEFDALLITEPEELAGEIPFAEATFAPGIAGSGLIEGPVIAVDPELGCEPLSNASEIAGNVAIVERGTCPFVEKFRNAEAAGAAAIIIIDNQSSDQPFEMQGSEPVGIPGVMIRRDDGARVVAQLDDGVAVRFDGRTFERTAGPDYVASLSSRGPSSDFVLLKPEITAPGQSVRSTAVGGGTASGRLSGTSQASPFVAGAAALVRQAHPGYDAATLKAALVNTAGPVLDLDGQPFPVSLAGGGRVRVEQAVRRNVTAQAVEPEGAVAVAFGAIVTSVPTSRTAEVRIDNDGPDALTFDLRVAPTSERDGVTYAVDPPTVTLEAGESGTVSMILSVDPSELGAPQVDGVTPDRIFNRSRHYPIEADGVLLLEDRDGAESISLPFHSVVRAAAERSSRGAFICDSEPRRVVLPLDGETTHESPVVSAMELVHRGPGSIDSSDEDAPLELVAFGAAIDLGHLEDPTQGSVYFGLSVSQPWVTPAQGPLSVARIFLDVDRDGDADFIVVANASTVVPGTEFSQIADILNATVISIEDQEALEPRRVLNMVTRAEVDTQPYHNDVLVFPVTLAQIGLDGSNLRMGIAPVVGPPTDLPEAEDFIDVDLSELVLEPSRFGRNQQPFFETGRSIQVALPQETGVDQLPPLLLLHHTNAPGMRTEIVDFVELGDLDVIDGALTLEATVIEPPPAETPFDIDITVRNTGTTARRDVTLSAIIADATVLGFEVDDGVCTRDGELRCFFGDVEGGATRKAVLRAVASEGIELIGVETTLTSASGCETEPVVVRGNLEVGPVSNFEPGARGGCGCRTSSSGSGSWGWILAGLGLLWRRRRVRPR